jgi:hypothetical protein
MHIWKKTITAIVLLAVSIMALAETGPIGCYTVQITSKSRVEHAKSLRLTDKPASTPWGNGGGHQVLPAKAGESFNYSAAYWVIRKNDLVLTFSNNGLSGVEVHVHKVKDGFEGVINNFWDFGPSTTNVRPIKLTRVECRSVQ